MRTNVTIHGQAGPPVLLLPGGAEPTEDFFPGLVEGLLSDPGCRVILYDRPGTGTSEESGLLADAATDLNELIRELDLGPVIVVSQSLGGAVALLLAVQYPQAVAGLVLLEPTPINDAKGCKQLEQVMGITKLLYGVPGLHGLIQSQLLLGMRRSMKGKDLRPECSVALDRIGNTDAAKLADAVRGITQLSADFRLNAIPKIPTALVTADRKPDNYIRRSHVELAEAMGVPLVCWPNSAHNVQLDHPDETLEIVRSVIAQTSLAI
jgi:pimeloyl-ACP methyl ester carboxylesterase